MKTVNCLILEDKDFTQPDGNLRKAAFEAFASNQIVISGDKVLKNQCAEVIPSSNTRNRSQTHTPPQAPREDTTPSQAASINTLGMTPENVAPIPLEA